MHREHGVHHSDDVNQGECVFRDERVNREDDNYFYDEDYDKDHDKDYDQDYDNDCG